MNGPVRKDYCESIQNTQFLEEYSRIESVINKVLTSGERKQTISGFTPKFKEKMVQYVIDQYTKAGWKVKRVNGGDCREYWDYLVFA